MRDLEGFEEYIKEDETPAPIAGGETDSAIMAMLKVIMGRLDSLVSPVAEVEETTEEETTEEEPTEEEPTEEETTEEETEEE